MKSERVIAGKLTRYLLNGTPPNYRDGIDLFKTLSYSRIGDMSPGDLWEEVGKILQNEIPRHREREIEYNTQPIAQNLKWSFAQHGLKVYIRELTKAYVEELAKEIPFLQEVIQGIPEGEIVGEMHFTPAGNKFIPGRKSFVLAEGVAGLDAFFEKIDEQNQKPKYLMGITSERMAKFATSVGFKCLKSITDKKGRLLFCVLGETETVKREFIAKKEKNSLERLFARAAHQPTPQSAL